MPRTHARPLFTASLLFAALGWLQVNNAQSADPRFPPKVEQLFRQAIESQPRSNEREDPKEANLAALAKLKTAPWPDVRSLQRVKIATNGEQSKGEQPAEQNVWLVSESESALQLLYDDFSIRPLARERVQRRQTVDYLAELHELLARHQTVSKNDRVVSVDRFHGGYLDGWPSRPPLLGDAILALHSYCAAMRGHDAEAGQLLAAALTRYPSAIDTVIREWSWSSFQRGIELLESGAPRKDVVIQWRQTLAGFPESSYTKQLDEYLPQLDTQVAEDEQFAKSAVADPESLSTGERLTYYTARFPDVRGVQLSQPGHCTTFGLGELTKTSDAVIAIGLPAIPNLIERLEDRRLTRSVGFWRNFSPHRIVLRVQDVAIQAIEKIVSERFYEVRTSSSYFSTEEPATRAEIIGKVKAWWKENSSKSPLEMHFSRLDEGRAYERIDRLHKILKLDPQALNPVATLKRWAENSSGDDKTEYVAELATRGDSSFLPQIRERALDRGKLPDTRAIWHITQYGNVSDYRILRETMLDERRKGAFEGNGSSPYGSIISGIKSTKNPLAVPLLVDMLTERKGEFSQADQCFQALSKLTGEDGGYVRDASSEERHAAIDRWIEWWKREGQEAFLKLHPAVREVIAERKIAFKDPQVAKLPPMVVVADASDELPVNYDVPRQLLPGLLNAGQVAAQEDALGRPTFRFTSPDAGLAWFDAAEPVQADDAAGSKLVPAMRVKTRGLTRPDSSGRVWCTWDRALSPIAVFDGKKWQSFAEPLPPGYVDNPIGFISVFQGNEGAMIFLDRNHRFHIFDDTGHVRAESAADLLSQYGQRIQRALPQPCPSSDAFYFHLVKDGLGHVWWSNWETDWGVVDGTTVIRAADAIPSVEVKRGYRHDLLFPAADGKVYVFQLGNPGHGVLAELSNGNIVRIADLPIADLDHRQTAVLAVRDSLGRVWFATRNGSRALDTTGKVVAEHRGRVVKLDRDGGVWFQVGSSVQATSLTRLAQDGREAELPLPRLRPFWPLAESPDGTFWAVSGSEIVHIRRQGDQLVEVERFAVPQSNYIWCDNRGRVWLTGTGREEQAVRLAVGKRL